VTRGKRPRGATCGVSSSPSTSFCGCPSGRGQTALW